MYIKNLIFLFIIVICNYSCKNDYDKAIEDEEIQIKKYLLDNDFVVQAQESGLYYIKINEGTGDSISNGDFISANINISEINDGLNNARIDSNITLVVNNNPLLKGINEGINLMLEGETAQLIIPFSLSYYSPIALTSNYTTYISEIKINEIIDDPSLWELNRIFNYINNIDFSYDTLIIDSTSGLTKIRLVKGIGEDILYSNTVNINYTGTLINGEIFDDNYINESQNILVDTSTNTTRNSALSLGLIGMKKDEEAIVIIPSSLAYGSSHYQYTITSYSTLIFQIEVNEVVVE